MSKEQHRLKDNPQKKSSKIDPTILVAIITALGTVIVALITAYAKPQVPAQLTQTVTATFTVTAADTPVPTDTVPPGAPTSTPLPATDTPTTTATPISPVALGKDWIAGCISTLWKPYPSGVAATAKGDGCWQEPVHVFSAENGDLDFLADQRKRPVETYGLFAPLPESGTVTFTVRLKELDNVDLWMGVFAEPDVNSRGLLMIIPSGDVKRRPFVYKDPLNYETIASSSMLDQRNGSSISFSFTLNAVRSSVNPNIFVINPISLPTSKKWLFLGYKGLGGSYRVEGTFLSFELK